MLRSAILCSSRYMGRLDEKQGSFGRALGATRCHCKRPGGLFVAQDMSNGSSSGPGCLRSRETGGIHSTPAWKGKAVS